MRGSGEARLWTTVAAVIGAVVVMASVSEQVRVWANWFGWALAVAAVLWLPGWVLVELARQRREVRDRVIASHLRSWEDTRYEQRH